MRVAAGLAVALLVGCGEASSGPSGPDAGSAVCTASPPPRGEALVDRRDAIVGGAPSSAGQWPFLGRLVLDGEHHCGAALVSPEWLLTAAHCIERAGARPLEVVLGDHDTGVVEASEQWFEPAVIVVHPEHDTLGGLVSDHDLALVRLDRPVELTDAVRPIALAPACGLPGQLWIAGWGSPAVGQPATEVPHAALVPLASEARCGEHLAGLEADEQANDVLCVGHEGGAPGACHRDSGGPVVWQDPVHGWQLAGIVFAGGPRCDELTLVVRLGGFQPWIQERIGQQARSARRHAEDPSSEELSKGMSDEASISRSLHARRRHRLRRPRGGRRTARRRTGGGGGTARRARPPRAHARGLARALGARVRR